MPLDAVAYFLPRITPIPEKNGSGLDFAQAYYFPQHTKSVRIPPGKTKLISEFKNRKWCAF